MGQCPRRPLRAVLATAGATAKSRILITFTGTRADDITVRGCQLAQWPAPEPRARGVLYATSAGGTLGRRKSSRVATGHRRRYGGGRRPVRWLATARGAHEEPSSETEIEYTLRSTALHSFVHGEQRRASRLVTQRPQRIRAHISPPERPWAPSDSLARLHTHLYSSQPLSSSWSSTTSRGPCGRRAASQRAC